MIQHSRRSLFLAPLQSAIANQVAEASYADPIHFLTPDDEGFAAELKEHFLRIEDRPDFQFMRKFCVLARNKDTKHIRAYTIIWNYLDSAEPAIPKQFIVQYIARHSFLAGTGRHIEKGSLSLISPFFNIKPREFRPDVMLIAPSLLQNQPLQRSTVTSVHLDAAVVSSGRLFGPDSLGLQMRYMATRNAERDEALSVQYHSSKSEPPWDPQTIDALLQRHIEIGRSSLGSKPNDLWWLSRGMEAQRLRKRLASGGVNLLQSCIEMRLKYNRAIVKNKV